MIPFQGLAIPVLALLLVVDLYRMVTGRDRGLANLLRCGLWLAAMVAIAWPNMLTWIAHGIGIRRGTDLVLYIFVFAFLGSSFYFYSRCLRLERQLTQVVRHLALGGAQRDEPPLSTSAPWEPPGPAAPE